MTFLLQIIVNLLISTFAIGLILTTCLFLIDPKFVLDCFLDLFNFKIEDLPKKFNIKEDSLKSKAVRISVIAISFLVVLMSLGLLSFISYSSK